MLIFKCSTVRVAPQKSLMVLNRVILVASWYRHDEKIRSQQISLAIKPYSLELCSMWNYLVETTYSPSRILQWQVKKSRLPCDHNAPNWRWQSFHRSFRRNKVQLHLRTKERTKHWLFLVFFSSITWGFLEPQIWQFCLLIYPPDVKCAMIRWRKFCSENFRPNTHSTHLRRFEWSADFSCYVSWTLNGCKCRSKCKIRDIMP